MSVSSWPRTERRARPAPPAAVVLIGGPARSGTSLVNLLHGAHPQIHAVPTDWVIFDRYAALAHATGLAQPQSTADMARALDAVLTLPNIAKWGVDREALAAVEPRWPPSWDAVFLTMLEALRAQHPGQRIALKKPTSELHCPRIRDVLHDHDLPTRFVYCVRSPYDTYLSWKHRAKAWFGRDTIDTDLHLWVATWLETTSRGLELAMRYPGWLHVVRYEDVIADPQAACRELCAFLELDDAAEAMAEGATYRPNSSFDAPDTATKVAGAVHRPEASARPTLEDHERAEIARLCGHRARAFGYDLEPAPGDARGVEHEAGIALLPSRQLISITGRRLARRLRKRLARR